MIDRNGPAADAPEAAGVLVAVDGSAPALGAARWAGLYALQHDAPLTIGCAVQLPVPTGAAGATRIDFLEALRRRSRRALERAEEAARGVMGADAEVTSELWDGPAIPAILDAARSASVVVLGDSGLGESPEAVAGSVTSALTAHCSAPVIVVPEWSGGGEASCGGPVVVGVDLSTHSDAALRFAINEAQARSVELHVVHAWSDLPLTSLEIPYPPSGSVADGADGAGGVASGSPGGAGAPGESWEAIAQHEDAVLAEALAGWQEEYPDVVIRREVVHDRPVRHLLLASQNASLLVVGRRGRGGFTGMMVGSTSRALLHSAPCPLAVLHDPEAQNAP